MGGLTVSGDFFKPNILYRKTVFRDDKVENYLDKCGIDYQVQANEGAKKHILEDESGKLHRGNCSIKFYAWRHRKRE